MSSYAPTKFTSLDLSNRGITDSEGLFEELFKAYGDLVEVSG